MQLTRKILALSFLFVLIMAMVPAGRAQGDADEPGATETVDDEYVEEVEVDEPTEPAQQMYVMPAADVATSVKFVGVEGSPLRFVAGDEVTALIGMHNSGDKTYNVSYVGAHLHSPYDQSFYVQNFTVRWTANLLPPRSEVTIEYRFRPDEKLEPLDFHLSGWLIYNDSTVPTQIIYRSLFVNQTVEVLERRAEWTLASAITWTIGAAGIALAAYVFSQQGTTLMGGKKKRAGGVSSPSGGEGAAAGWEVKAYKPAAVQKAVGSKKMQKPLSKK